MTTPVDTDVLILAGGRGERSRSYLGTTPKFLAPISGLPLATHLLTYLTEQGIRRVVLALSGNEGGADQILAWLATLGRPTIDIFTSTEPEPHGITSATIAARPQLLSDPVMIINGDTLLDLDLATVLSRYKPDKLTVTAPDGTSSGCVVMSQVWLRQQVRSISGGITMTTSRPFVDIGTREGYEAACAGTWKR